MELVLSSTTSFFRGNLKAAFQNARKFGFSYLEIIPYRWSNPQEILKLEKEYGVQVVGIHLTEWWRKSFWQAFRDCPDFWEKLFSPIWQFYLGNSVMSSSWQIAQSLRDRKPYLVLHANLLFEMGEPELRKLSSEYRILAENLPFYPQYPKSYWDLNALKADMQQRGIVPGFVFDPGHFYQNRQKHPELDIFQTYQNIKPEVIHISYNNFGFHNLPNRQEQTELSSLLRLHKPQYLVLETRPDISLAKSKRLMEKILGGL